MHTDCIPRRIKQEAWDFLKDNNLGNRFTANGNKEEQYVGLLGEMMLCKVMGVHHNMAKGFDGGFDLLIKDRKTDVKTMGRTVDPKPHYVNNFMALQEHFDCELYIFCSINKKTSEFTICGWVTKQELLHKAKLYPKGTIRTRTNGTTFELKADTYEILNSELNHIYDLKYL